MDSIKGIAYLLKMFNSYLHIQLENLYYQPTFETWHKPRPVSLLNNISIFSDVIPP